MNEQRIETYRVETRNPNAKRYGEPDPTWHAQEMRTYPNIDDAVDAAHIYAADYPEREVRVVRSVAYAEQVAIIRPTTTEGAGR